MRQFVMASALLAALCAPAAAGDYYGGVGYRASDYALPPCNTSAVLATIPSRFAHQDRHITHTGLSIVDIFGVHQHGIRAGGPGLIDRRYCGATALLSNGRKSEVVFIIEAPMVGFASIGYHVESCLPSFDPYRVYDKRCRSLRP